MALVSLRNVTVGFGGPPVLDGVSLSVRKGERSCVTGRNGEGKSTLLKILAGLLEPDGGDVIRDKGVAVSYLSQDVPADRPDDPAFNALSGGRRRRKLLEEVLLAKPDLLLLDEPTNHLDVESVEWLESCLRRTRAAVLFVTHDRAFLRRVATRVLDLDRGELAGWDCDWPTFLKRKAELLADEAVYWERKSKKLAQEEAWIRRGVKARTTRNEGRVAALLALRKEFAARRHATGAANLKISAGAESGQLVLKAEGVTFAYGNAAPVVADFTGKVFRGERIGIVGANGSGKTTLLNLLTGRLAPQAGAVTPGARVELAYLDQLRGGLDPEKSVVENLADDRNEVVVAGVRKHVYSYLGDFLFTPERARTPVKVLSGGERARLVFARRFMDPGNLLVLDEPTNDLDVETLELLEEQLMAYRGTVLLVSHDREFLDHVVTSCFVLPGDGRVLVSAGGYGEAARLLARERAASVRDGAVDARTCGGGRAAEVAAEGARRRKLSYGETRELEALPAEIEGLEGEIAALEKRLADPAEFVRDARGMAVAAERLGAAKDELERAVERWAELEVRR